MTHLSKCNPCDPYFQVWPIFSKCHTIFQLSSIFHVRPFFSKRDNFFPSVTYFSIFFMHVKGVSNNLDDAEYHSIELLYMNRMKWLKFNHLIVLLWCLVQFCEQHGIFFLSGAGWSSSWFINMDALSFNSIIPLFFTDSLHNFVATWWFSFLRFAKCSNVRDAKY